MVRIYPGRSDLLFEQTSATARIRETLDDRGATLFRSAHNAHFSLEDEPLDFDQLMLGWIGDSTRFRQIDYSSPV